MNVFLGHGTGIFGARMKIEGGARILFSSPVVTDLNCDGYLDLVAIQANAVVMGVLLNTGDCCA